MVSLFKNGKGLIFGLFERIVILSVGIWTIINPHLPHIQEKGLVSRQAFFIILIFVLPYLAWKKRIPLKKFPFVTDSLILSPLFVDTVGNFSSYFILSYDRWDFFDKLAHFWGSGVFTFLAFVIFIAYFYARDKKIEIFYIFWFAIAVGVGLEGFWEIWEYSYDFSHGTILVGGIGDTIGDVVAGFFGSLTASSLCTLWYIKTKDETKKKYFSLISQLFDHQKSADYFK